MTLLDIIIDPNDTLLSDVTTGKQQLADVAPIPTETVGMMSDNLLLTIIVVLVALCLCFYFVWKYRKNKA